MGLVHAIAKQTALVTGTIQRRPPAGCKVGNTR
jgi:hypothetical protein